MTFSVKLYSTSTPVYKSDIMSPSLLSPPPPVLAFDKSFILNYRLIGSPIPTLSSDPTQGPTHGPTGSLVPSTPTFRPPLYYLSRTRTL